MNFWSKCANNVPLILQLQAVPNFKDCKNQKKSKLTNINLPGLPKNIATGIIVISKINITIIIPSFSFLLFVAEMNK